MTSHSLKILLLLQALYFLSEVVAEDKICLQCASPNLEQNWALSGLPKRPDNLNFNKGCAKAAAAEKEDPLFQSTTCSSSCFELLIPLNGYYEYVRGCHENFVWDEFKISGNTTCQMNVVPDLKSVGFRSETDIPARTVVYSGMAFCPPAAVPCNSVFSDTTLTDTILDNCQTGTSHSCKKCSEYDGDGECSPSTTNTCKGVYCTKTSGKMNGHFYETRGCAFFNPFLSNICSWTQQNFNISTGLDSARSKRSVTLTFQADQCYCQGELCNSSPPPFSSFLLSLFSALFLYFH